MLDEWFRNSGSNDDDRTQNRWKSKGTYLLIIVICLGLLALVWPTGRKDTPPASSEAAPAKTTATASAKGELAANLEDILSQIEGAGQVSVNLYLESDGIRTYASNSRDESREISEGGADASVRKTSEQTSERDLATSGSSPLLVEKKTPQVLGVLVVADGADSPAVCEKLIDATSTLLNIAPNQVSVMPRQKN